MNAVIKRNEKTLKGRIAKKIESGLQTQKKTTETAAMFPETFVNNDDAAYIEARRRELMSSKQISSSIILTGGEDDVSLL